MNRGHRSGALFLNDADRRRFLGAAAELPERFGLELHAFVLMHNHYHLLVRTGGANLSQAIRWEDLVTAAEAIRGEAWAEWSERHGDWGRDAVMYVAVHHGGLRLAKVVRHVGLKYQAAAQAVKRYGQALVNNPARKRFVAKLGNALSMI